MVLLLFSSTILTVYSVSYFIQKLKQSRRLPPGPWGLPFVGYAPFIPNQYDGVLKKLVSKYGKVFSMNIYGTDVILVSDFEVIKKLGLKDAFNYRPNDWMFTAITRSPNIACWNGPEWFEQRKFAIRIFKQLGLGKQIMEDKIHKEIDYLCQQVESQQKTVDKRKGINLRELLGPSASNIVNQLVCGERFDFDHPTRKLIDDAFLPKESDPTKSPLGIFNFMPALVRSSIRLPLKVVRQFLIRLLKVKKYVKNKMKEMEISLDTNDESDNFIQAYLKQMKDSKSGSELKYLDHDHLYGNAFGFLGAGSGTTKDVMEWFLTVVLIYPEVQEKMRQEIDSVVGSERKVSYQDKSSLPYCEAVFAEVERISSSIPLGIYHCMNEDVEVNGYFFPKGTQVAYNCLAVHSDPEFFSEPEKFKPERFLTSDGKKFVRNEHVITFGSGKRSCPGEPIARIEIFLYMTSILQKYKVTPAADMTYTMEGELDFVGRTTKNPLRCLFNPRDY